MAPQKRGPLPFVAAGCGLLALCALCSAAIAAWRIFSLRGTAASQPAVEYVLDASPRMAQASDTGSGTRFSVAQSVLDEIVRPSDPAVTAGLRVFGSGAYVAGKQPQACADTDLLVPLARASQAKISASLLAVNTGSQPDAAMAAAVVAALRDLAATQGPHTLVVVTGGSDSCSDQAGQLIAAAAKKSGIDYQLFVVGYQVPDDQGSALSGLVDSAGSGHYVSAHTKGDLTAVLHAIQAYAEHPVTTSVSSVLATAAALPTATTPAFGQTACDNPYLPLRLGSSWQYRHGTGDIETWTVTAVSGDTTAAAVSMRFTLGDRTLTGDWQCSGLGIATTYEPDWAAAAPLIRNYRVESSTGIWFPPADQLVAGATWDTGYAISYDGNNAATPVQRLETIVERNTCAATEQVTAGGKTYQAVRVDTSRTVEYRLATQAPSTQSIRFVFGVQTWYARGVGMVLTTSTVQSGPTDVGTSTSSELETYHIP